VSLVRLGIPKICRLLARLIWKLQALPEQVLAWSLERRVKQEWAKIAHYRRPQSVSVLSLNLRL
jgi:hypothetical protein